MASWLLGMSYPSVHGLILISCKLGSPWSHSLGVAGRWDFTNAGYWVVGPWGTDRAGL